jgi:hypothetical protein
VNATGWSRGLEVSGGGAGVVSHAGLVLLRHLADKTGLTSGLSRAPRAWHRHFPPSRGPRGPEEPRTWPTTKSGPWVCNVLCWREASAQLLRLRGKGPREMR